jgi:hypothetical protein
MNSKIHIDNVDLVIGIIGHRWVRESPGLHKAIDRVVEEINHAYSRRSLKILSPLAEGADRIVAKRILSSPEAHLIALLPFPAKDYLEDFSTPESVKEFQDLCHQADQVIELHGNQVRDDAYAVLGKTLLDASAVLIAIWDGEPARGRGGTAEIVQEARDRGLPLAWILQKQPESSGSEMRPSEERQIEVFFERFP